MIVDSGHGLHVYWLFNEPIEVNDQERKFYEPKQRILQSSILEADSTHDSGRILRIAGTMNVKGDPVECKIIEENEKRYTYDDFDFLENIKQQKLDGMIIRELPSAFMRSIAEIKIPAIILTLILAVFKFADFTSTSLFI
jgi:hypothetical protein